MNTPNPFPGYLTTTQASEAYPLSQPQLALLCRRGPAQGGLVCIKLAPHLWLVEEASLVAYLASNPKPGPKPASKQKRANR